MDGKLNFTSETDPDTGRAGNQGQPVPRQYLSTDIEKMRPL